MTYDAASLMRQADRQVRRIARRRGLRLSDADREDLVSECIVRVLADFDPTRSETPAVLLRFRVVDVFQDWSDSLELTLDPEEVQRHAS